jgi:hypothetical protein
MKTRDMAMLAFENKGKLLRTVLGSKLPWTLALRGLARRPWWIAGALALGFGRYWMQHRRA